MRKIIAALIVSVDGFIEGPAGELDWVDTWEDAFDLLPQIDTCILGRKMYPGYEQYWGAILANPDGILPFTGRVALPGEDILQPLVLGGGKALFQDVRERHALTFAGATPLPSGQVRLTYRT